MSKNIKTQIVTVTAEYAAELLAKNTKNRKVGDANLARIKTALLRGEWKFNGEAIKIAPDGTILDGQHRLIACVETGISFMTLIIFGVEPETQTTMDTGKSRTAADVLTLAGFKSSTTLAAIIAAIIRTEQYSLRAGTMPGGYIVTRTQILERAKSEPQLSEIVKMTNRYKRLGLSGATAGLTYYVFSNIDAEDADFFFDKLLTGEGLERGNPILTLRNTLGALRSEVRGQRNQTYITAIVVKAWNKFRLGEDCLQLKFTTGGSSPERFPEPK